mgnify:CR=1 FL=1|jgi:hypothetical protein
MLDDLIEFLFYKPGGKKELDTQKIAGLLGLGVGLSGGFEPYRPKVGYQGSIPKYTAVREPVNIPYSPNRRPGSGGRRYFSDITYVPEGGDVGEAISSASQQATDLGLQNLQNFYSYPPSKKADISGVFTAEEGYAPSKLAEIMPIPGADEAISSGIVGLSGQKGLASGGIAGYKHGGFHLTDPSTYIPSLKKAGQTITDGIASVFSGDGSNDSNEPSKDLAEYQEKYPEGGSGFGNVLDPSTYSMGNLKTGFTNIGNADQRADYMDLTPLDRAKASMPGFVDTVNMGGSDDEELRDKAYNAYRRAAGGSGRSDARAEYFKGGSKYDMAAANPQDHDMSVYNQQLQGKNVNGVTVVGYTDTSGNFVPLTKNDADRALAEGIVNMEGSDSQTTPDTTSTTTSTSSNMPAMPASVSALNLDLNADNIGSYTSLTAEYASLTPKKQAEAIDNFDKIAKGTLQASISPQMAANTRDYLQQLSAMKKAQLNKFLADITAYGDLLGVGGQQGIGMNVGGLLKSSEDGMTDTLPAQVGPDPVMLSGGEYIMDAEIVSMLGNGNTDAGAKVLDEFRENVRRAKHGGSDQGDQINPENFMSRLTQTGVA